MPRNHAGAGTDRPITPSAGRCRGGLTTKTHALVDDRGLPLVVAFTPQAGERLPGAAQAASRAASATARTGTPHHPDRAARGQGLFGAGAPRAPAVPRHHRSDPRTDRPDPTPPQQRQPRRTTRHLRRCRLQTPQRRRTHFQPPQTLASPGHPMRQARPDLPRPRRPGQRPPRRSGRGARRTDGTAMESRAIIVAEGVLPAQQDLSADRAFKIVARGSQTGNRKLRDLAQAVSTARHATASQRRLIPRGAEPAVSAAGPGSCDGANYCRVCVVKQGPTASRTGVSGRHGRRSANAPEDNCKRHPRVVQPDFTPNPRHVTFSQNCTSR